MKDIKNPLFEFSPKGSRKTTGPKKKMFGYTILGFGSGDAASFMFANGGQVSTSGNFRIHTFNSSGQFSVDTLGDGAVEYLVVAGGGGGGDAGPEGGGGGAGGVVNGSQTLDATGNFAVNIGTGGNGNGSNGKGSDGNNSVFSGNTNLTLTDGTGDNNYFLYSESGVASGIVALAFSYKANY